jgi:hypothetical protein
VRCIRCDSPVVLEEGLCRLCVRDLSRSRVGSSHLSFKPKPDEEETVMGQMFTSDAAKALHSEIDRAASLLLGLDVETISRRLHELVELDVRNPSAPDGFPTQVPGASVETRPAPVLQPCVDPETTELRHPYGEICDECAPVGWTTVERAGNARRGKDLDEVHRKVEAALGYLTDAANALRGAVNKMADIDKLRDTAGLQSGEPGCWALDRIGAWEPVLHRAMVDGVERPLGTWAYGFYRRNGRIPNRNECREHVAGRRVKNAVAVSA